MTWLQLKHLKTGLKMLIIGKELINRAVYTCIKNPESFVHSGFSWEVARQLPLNTAKHPMANVNACSNLAGYYSGFWSRDTWPSAESPDRGPRRTTHVRSKVERSRACAPLTKTPVWDSGFFAHALFVPKNPNVMGFSGSVNGTTTKPRFFGFWFCQCKWA